MQVVWKACSFFQSDFLTAQVSHPQSSRFIGIARYSSFFECVDKKGFLKIPFDMAPNARVACLILLLMSVESSRSDERMDPRYVKLEVYVMYPLSILTGDVLMLCCDSVGEAK